MEDPSNITLFSNASSNLVIGISTFLSIPIISVNCIRIYLIFSSLQIFLMSSLVNFMAFSPYHLRICLYDQFKNCFVTLLAKYTFAIIPLSIPVSIESKAIKGR